eukprot:scaffold12456_cov131-Isochrysis_galbana.AAC.4
MSGASGSRSSGVIGRAVGHHLHEVFSIHAQRKSATAAANKAAHAESQAKQFYKKYRPHP